MVHHGLCTRSWQLGSEKAFDWVDLVKIVSCFRGDHGSKLRLEATRSSLRSSIQFNPFEVAGFLCEQNTMEICLEQQGNMQWSKFC